MTPDQASIRLADFIKPLRNSPGYSLVRSLTRRSLSPGAMVPQILEIPYTPELHKKLVDGPTSDFGGIFCAELGLMILGKLMELVQFQEVSSRFLHTVTAAESSWVVLGSREAVDEWSKAAPLWQWQKSSFTRGLNPRKDVKKVATAGFSGRIEVWVSGSVQRGELQLFPAPCFEFADTDALITPHAMPSGLTLLWPRYLSKISGVQPVKLLF